MQARHKGILGAVACALLGLVLHRALFLPQADKPPAAPIAPIEVAVPQVRPLELIERIEASFKDIYLTQISIIQGVAFGFLAGSAFTGPSPSARQWLAYGTAFIVIVIVWQEYMVGSTAFTWIPTLLDSVTPYAIGILEFLIIIQVRKSTSSFLVAIAVTESIGLIAYTNYWLHARGSEVNRNSYILLGRYVRFGMAFHVLWSCPITILLAVLFSYVGKGYDLVFIAATIVVFMPLFLHSIFNWTLPLHRSNPNRGLGGNRARPGGYQAVMASTNGPRSPRL